MTTDRWEWRDEIPDVDEVVKKLETLPPVFGVKTIDYAQYVLPLTNREQIKDAGGQGTGQYVAVTKLYMQVAGRQQMIREAIERWGWKVTEEQELLIESGSGGYTIIRMNLSVDGEWGPGTKKLKVEGNRWGVGRAKGGAAPTEKAETTARGRSLGAWGFGVLPGSGIASLDEMQDAAFEEGEQRPNRGSNRRSRKDINREELIPGILTAMEQLRQIRSAGEEEVSEETMREGMSAYVRKNLGVDITADDGLDLDRLTNGQLVLLSQRYDGWISSARRAADLGEEP